MTTRHAHILLIQLTILSTLTGILSYLESYQILIPIFMLVLPYLNRNWTLHRDRYSGKLLITGALLATVSLLILLFHPYRLEFFISTLLLAAIPEEWFFRAYVQNILGNNIKAIVISSITFSLIHVLSRGVEIGLLVFIPSLFYGWVYRKYDNLTITVLCHALGNLLAVVFFNPYITYIAAQ